MDWIVFGLGKSVRLISRQDAMLYYNTIGVNDVDKFHTVNHLVVVDKWERFPDDRRSIISATQADTIWLKEARTFVGLENHPDIRYFKLSCAWTDKQMSIPQKMDDERIPYHYTSPFLGVMIAWKYLRAKRIGILGMDLLSDHHMRDNWTPVNEGFALLREELLKRGTELVNLSPIADFPALPLKPLNFIRRRS